MNNPHTHPLYGMPIIHPKTDKLYQRADATELFAAEALVTGIEPITGGFGIILNRTVAHPEGGGQPADKARITIPNSQGPDSIFYIDDVQSAAHGGIFHFINSGIDPREWHGKKVVVEVDPEFRRACRVYHTAGHLIGHVARGMTPRLGNFTKKDHTPGIASLEFRAKVPSNIVHPWRATLQEVIDETIRRIDGAPIVDTSFNARGPNPRGIILGQSSEPCEGTHVANMSEVRRIKLFGDVEPGEPITNEGDYIFNKRRGVVTQKPIPTTRIRYKVF